MNDRIHQAKQLNPGPSRRERRHKQDRKTEGKQRVALAFAESARKLAGRAPDVKPEPPKRPSKPRTQQPAWMVKQEAARLSWSWKPNG